MGWFGSQGCLNLFPFLNFPPSQQLQWSSHGVSLHSLLSIYVSLVTFYFWSLGILDKWCVEVWLSWAHGGVCKKWEKLQHLTCQKAITPIKTISPTTWKYYPSLWKNILAEIENLKMWGKRMHVRMPQGFSNIFPREELFISVASMTNPWFHPSISAISWVIEIKKEHLIQNIPDPENRIVQRRKGIVHFEKYTVKKYFL